MVVSCIAASVITCRYAVLPLPPGCSWSFTSVGSGCALNYPNVLQNGNVKLIPPDKLGADADFQEEEEVITHAG